MLDVLRVRIYPNKEQETALSKSFGCCRFVWNYYLEKTNNHYKETGKRLSYCDMAKDLTQLKKLPDYSFLQEATAATLQQSLKNLESAFKNFFAHRSRFPKFKSKHKKQSIRYPESCSIKGKGLKLPKLGIVKAKFPKTISGKIKSVTVSKTSTDKYFAAILFETNDLISNKTGKISGIDLGLTSLVTVFDGETYTKVDPIKPTRKYAKLLKRRQQALSRKKKGSNNRKKQIKRVAKVHEKIANTRGDFLHKLSRQLVDENQVIVVEDLCVKGLARTKLAKSVLDAGFGMLINFLNYKLEREGGKLMEVDRFFPSTKLCHCCQFKNNSLNLSVRDWVCPNCQTHHDRDENAARNIREEGIRILSTNTAGHTEIQACGEDVRLVGTSTKKHSSVKQELNVKLTGECQRVVTQCNVSRTDGQYHPTIRENN